MVSGFGPMKMMPVVGAGLGEFRAFRQQAVAGMDGVGARQPGDADHLVDRQIALDRPQVTGEMRPRPTW